MGSMECGGVLFDLDGVLVDSTPCVTRVWRAWALEHGLDPDRVVRLAHGRRAIETVELVAPQLDSAAQLVEIEQRELEDTDGLVVIEGAARLLASLPVDRWAVVTSGTRRLATKRLQVSGLPIPGKMVSADEVKLGKPNPAPYIRGAELLGLAAADCVAVEDAPSGIEAAQRAEMKVLAVPTTYDRSELRDADVLLDSLAQLKAGMGRAVDGKSRVRLSW